MNKACISILAALPLALGASAAQAHDHGSRGGPGDGTPSSPQALVFGKVVSVNSAAGTFVADAAVATQPSDTGGNDSTGDGSSAGSPGDAQTGADSANAGGDDDSTSSYGGHEDAADTGTTTTTTSTTPTTTTGTSSPTLTEVKVTTNSSTTFEVNHRRATLADLTPGAQFEAAFNGSSTDTLQALVASPALDVRATSPRQLYAFVGTVSAVDPTACTVSVTVSNSLPAGLVPAGSGAHTFTVGESTIVLGGSNGSTSGHGPLGGSLSNVSVGDVVAGGVIGGAGETLSQVGASPLALLLDLPTSSTSSTGTGTSATPATTAAFKARALRQALALMEGKSLTSKHAVKKATAKNRGKRTRTAAHRRARR